MQLQFTARPSLAHNAGQCVLLGLLTFAPAVDALMAIAGPSMPPMAQSVADARFRALVSVFITNLGPWLIGSAASRVAGRRLIEEVEAVLERIPLVQTVYGRTMRFITAMWRPPSRGQRVVLISFPSPEMKTVGFITSALREETTSRERAAVRVPTARNPTSGYLEIMPLHEVVYVDSIAEQVMSFLVTGGANAIAALRFQSRTPGDTKVKQPL